MAVTIATLKAVVTADIGQFQSGMNTAQNTVKKTANEADKAKKRFDDLASSLNKLGSMLSLGVTAPLIALGKAAIDTTVRMDSLKRGLTAIAGSAGEAEKQLVRLKEVAKLPGLSFEGAIQGSIRLQAAGISAKQAEASLKAFGNAIATVGGSSAQLDGVTLALSQIQSKGKVLAEEINQLSERVPQVRAAMIHLFGTADTEILQKAKLTSQEFIGALTDELAKAKPVVGGLQNTFENAQQSINESLDRIGKAIAPLVAYFLEKFVPALEKITKAFDGLPEQTKTLAVAFGALTIAGGPLLLLTGQILELGKAIGIARLAALGPVAGIAALLGIGAMAGLAAWNADSDRRLADMQSRPKPMQDIEKMIADTQARIDSKKAATTIRGGVILNSRVRADVEREEALLVDLKNRYLDLATKNEIAYQNNARKLAEENLAFQKKKAMELAALQKRVLEAKTAKERAEAEAARRKAEAEAKRVAAEAERRRKVAEDLTTRYNRLTMDRYDLERYEANLAYQDALRDGANRIKAHKTLMKELSNISVEEVARVEERIKKSEFPIPAFMKANRKGIGSLTPEAPRYAEPPMDFGDFPLIHRDTPLGRPDRRKAIITEPDANARNKEIDLFFQDFTRQARQSSRELLRSILGGRGRDRADVFKEFFEGMKNAFVDAIVNSPIERLKKIFEPIADNFGKAMQDALVAAVKVAQSGVGQLLGAVYGVLSALNRKKKFGIGSAIGLAAGFAFGGFGGAATGYGIGNALDNGDYTSAFGQAVFAGVNGTFSGGGAKGGGNGTWDLNPPTAWDLNPPGVSRAQHSQTINIGTQIINDRADAKRVATEFNQRLENQIRSGVV